MNAVLKPRVALLPLYLELYDRVVPDLLPRQRAFAEQVAGLLRAQGMAVTVLEVCRTRAQTAAALGPAVGEVDGIVTLHLTYSPSLEAAPPLLETDLPLLLLDTTPKSEFGGDAGLDEVLENHGIHGVQDLANLLRRHGRPYSVIAGALGSPHLAQRALDWARAALARRWLRRLRVALIGDPFPGMGDFQIPREALQRTLGPAVVRVDPSRVVELSRAATAEELAAEKQADLAAFDCSACPDDCRQRSARMGLGLRRALEEVGAEAFSMNFACFDRAFGAETVPFLEASKAMSRGMGYAGEGDALSASLVGALNACYAPTTFTEMFCPDWAGGRILMSHMGECNLALARGRPRLVEKDYAFGPVDNPAVAIFPLRPGPAALVNIAPGKEDALALIAADVVIDDAPPAPGLPDVPHFWIAPPAGDVARFLERYSQAGGTHHLALTPGLPAGAIGALADALGCDFSLLD